MSVFRVDGEYLCWGEQRVLMREVHGFYESISPWTSRGLLRVVGPGWTLPIGDGYGTNRKWLRKTFPSVPFESDWMDGRFPVKVMGLPPAWASLAALLVVITLAFSVGWVIGGAGVLLVILAWVWPFGHVRSQVVIQTDGVRFGPPWIGLTPWHQVECVIVEVGSKASGIRMRSKQGGASCVVPTVLLPAIRARLWRLGGLNLESNGDAISARYLRWSGPSWGLPWGILLGVSFGVWFAEEPWHILTVGVICSAAVGLLGAAVRARAHGWSTGGAFWMVALYALGLVVLSLAMSGWLN